MPHHPIVNPYENCKSGWLKGLTHAHVNVPFKSVPDKPYAHGCDPTTIYEACRDMGMQFVCMALDVQLDGIDLFGDASGTPDTLITIPTREIQNNYLTPPGTYFSAYYLHTLTFGLEGPSICAHPAYYGQDTWEDIQKDLLDPNDQHLVALNVNGLEVYNGFSPAVSARFYENCWDDMLQSGKLYFGYTGNDSYYRSGYTLSRFAPYLGHNWVSSEPDAASITQSLAEGKFYGSTLRDMTSPPVPTAPFINEDSYFLEFSEPELKWNAVCYLIQGRKAIPVQVDQRQDGQTYSVQLPETDWSYLRVQASMSTDPNNNSYWNRIWMQPILGPNWPSPAG